MTGHTVTLRLGPPYIERGAYWHARCTCGAASPRRLFHAAARQWKADHLREQRP